MTDHEKQLEHKLDKALFDKSDQDIIKQIFDGPQPESMNTVGKLELNRRNSFRAIAMSRTAIHIGIATMVLTLIGIVVAVIAILK
jgi:hypothetical protein